ncbi:glutamyl-tRNA reductase [Agaribacter marinus]|uniref:Glutamyl-tRNA reductase n=1 Tax=Agaribacter marinus TaxID=1431249 RepID=A0AA37SVX1_9ALTE|nr:glutamyl-tRNA reductase [Agaribacter marinus]GLR70392.1 glutamyl-tRNA reductase [Agaribacter marinus]
MPFVSIGINHNSASVALRERVAFTPDKLMRALSSFVNTGSEQEIVILSTCNRTEIYAANGLDENALQNWLADFHSVDKDALLPHVYKHDTEGTITHLMQVASGLDSLILGEPQILGQVKQAYGEAKRAGTVGTQLNKLFQTTFAVAKQVRTQTDIGANAVSVAFAAVQLTKQIFSSIEKSSVLLVGAGETIELVGRHLSEQRVKRIVVANRTLENAQRLANELNGEAITISQIPSHLAGADVVISSTASSLPLIGTGMVSTALKQRKHKPMLLIDLAVPRDIETEVEALDDAYLYTVDDLQDIISQNLANREQAAAHASALVDEKAAEFLQWLEHAKHVDLIRSYRTQAELLTEELLAKSQSLLLQGENPSEVLSNLANKLSKQLMHGPTKAIQLGIQSKNMDAIDVLKNGLMLDDKNVNNDE